MLIPLLKCKDGWIKESLVFIVNGWKTEAKWGVDEPRLEKVKTDVMNKCFSGYFFQSKGIIAEIAAIK